MSGDRPAGRGGAVEPDAAAGGTRRGAAVRRVGAEVDEAVRKALAFVLRSTGQRPQTEAEVAAKLRARGLDDAAVAATLAEARALGALDDAALASAWVQERCVGRGYAAARVRQELLGRGVVDGLVDEALRGLGSRDEAAVATEVARRRLRRLPAGLRPEAVARRLAGHLIRRGYPPALARRVAIEVSGLDRGWD